jgi:hypothetical protein
LGSAWVAACRFAQRHPPPFGEPDDHLNQPHPEVQQQVLSLGADFLVSKIDSPQLLIEAFRECEKRLINGEIASPKLDR